MSRVTVIASILVLLPLVAQAQMDCDAMFQESEAMISANEKMSVEEKIKLYEMAAQAYRQCGQGDEQGAQDLFEQVFDTGGRM